MGFQLPGKVLTPWRGLGDGDGDASRLFRDLTLAHALNAVGVLSRVLKGSNIYAILRFKAGRGGRVANRPGYSSSRFFRYVTNPSGSSINREKISSRVFLIFLTIGSFFISDLHQLFRGTDRWCPYIFFNVDLFDHPFDPGVGNMSAVPGNQIIHAVTHGQSQMVGIRPGAGGNF